MFRSNVGFRLGHRLVKVFRWCIHRRTRRRATYRRLQPRSSTTTGPFSKLYKWVHSLRRGARSLCSGKSNSGYTRAGEDPKLPVSVPKGHLAVYVGDKEDDTCRVLVPVIYFNHPLFGELLGEAEKVYGFDHPGGIQIPCPKSELENIQMKIAAVSGGGSWRRRRS
ncbi:hypothetical protein DH2020_027605 [Rehmannia glutinosa]|uniref:Uncharacterized protein n=1 Tax=Rehmannia glutinosa TaxID=99300 RepID=A0ABR0VVK6_REHGL